MRITISDNYFHEWDCPLDDCQRQYCSEHRLIWRECETAIETRDGAGQTWWEMRECPLCVADERLKRYEELIKEAV